MPPPTYLQYWGKARPGDPSGPGWHPLAYHSLDVAAVGSELLTQWPSLRRWLVTASGVGDRHFDQWLAFWLALHDPGKFAEAFQGQRADLFEAARGRPPKKPYTVRHDSLGMWVWRDVLSTLAGTEQWFGSTTSDHPEALDFWARAVTGHHGQPPQEGGHWAQHFDTQADREALIEFCGDLRRVILGDDFTPLDDIDPEAFLASSIHVSWWIAGLAVLADWLGSNTDYFPYKPAPSSPTDLADYWVYAKAQAVVALKASGVLAPHSTESLGISSLFPAIATPSPLQHWAATTPLEPRPQIHLLEDVTGAGKTEAAMMLTHRLMAQGIADGFFIGLPTMATANAMYARVAQTYAKLFAGNASLVLANGQRDLVDAFAATVLEPGLSEEDPAQGDETATARCAAWLADHNKRALLAPAGVGTIDQALLAVLQSRHQSLRLLGLTRKVLLVDEVHACDDYMLGVLKVVLECHARAGGSAVLLSATLPRRMKTGLVQAFTRGCSGEPRSDHRYELAADAYPLATSWAGGDDAAPVEHPLATRPEVRRKVDVHYVHDEGEVVAAINASLNAGRCVCWIRNTVIDAVAAYERFEADRPPGTVMLFHARFTLRDRLDKEQVVLNRFGPSSGPDDRLGRLLIATQVVEQSLDVDFDLVVTDLAPIDRIVQRAGRLCRHPRDAVGARLPAGQTDQRGAPCLWVFGPAWQATPDAGWFKKALPKAAMVYGHHGQLWLTAKALQEGGFVMPDDARRLIEGVFGTDADFPPGLQSNANAAEGKGWADASQAQVNTIKLEQGYSRSGFDWWTEAKTPSRLGEESVTVMLARWDGARLHPWVDGPHAWAYSSVRVAQRLVAAAATGIDPQRDAAVAAMTPTLPGQGKWSVLLPLMQIGGQWRAASVSTPDRRGRQLVRYWTYDAESGLQACNDAQGDAE